MHPTGLRLCHSSELDRRQAHSSTRRTQGPGHTHPCSMGRMDLHRTRKSSRALHTADWRYLCSANCSTDRQPAVRTERTVRSARMRWYRADTPSPRRACTMLRHKTLARTTRTRKPLQCPTACARLDPCLLFLVCPRNTDHANLCAHGHGVCDPGTMHVWMPCPGPGSSAGVLCIARARECGPSNSQAGV